MSDSKRAVHWFEVGCPYCAAWAHTSCRTDKRTPCPPHATRKRYAATQERDSERGIVAKAVTR